MALPALLPDDAPAREECALARRFHALANEKDLRAAAELLAPLRARLEAWILARFGPSIGGAAGAEAVATQALDNALLKAHQFDPERGGLWPWLVRIGRNVAIDEWTEARRARTRVGEDGMERALEPERGDEEGQHVLLELVRDTVRQLPKRARVLVKSRGRLSGKRLAELLGCSVGQVYNQRWIELSRLRERVERLER